MTNEIINQIDNTEFILKGADGKIKNLWNETKLGRFLREHLVELRIPVLCGMWRSSMVHHNAITNVGHAAANGRMSNQGAYSPFINIALGTGTQGTPATSTALAVEATTLGGARGAAAASQTTTTVTNDTTQLVKTFTFTGALALTEEGIFDSAVASSGTMLAYRSFSVVNVANTDTLQITHTYST